MGRHDCLILYNAANISEVEGSQEKVYPSNILREEVGAIEESLRFTAIPAAHKGIYIDQRIEPGLRLDADRRAMKQILLNILSNAVKFTNEGGRIAVRVRRIAGHAVFTIADTGRGIDQEFLPHIFETFSQEETGRTSVYGGTGLGLAIVKHVVQCHGARLNMKSQLGSGTRIEIKF